MNGISIFVSIPHYPMDYCIPHCLNFFEFHGITRKVTVWNTNEDEKSMFLFVDRWQYLRFVKTWKKFCLVY